MTPVGSIGQNGRYDRFRSFAERYIIARAPEFTKGKELEEGWQAIQDAKEAGCERYDLGGIRTGAADNSWLGLTKFKTGFAPDTNPVQFTGCYDIILKPGKYNLYRALQKIKRIFYCNL